MLRANYVEEAASTIAGTNGNGDVTLVQIDGFPRVSSVFGTGTVYIPYIMEDTANKRMETGIGSVTNGVLTRLKPQTTWDGTTYKNFNAVPLAFGSNPAAGTVRVRIGIAAETAAVHHPGMIPAGLTTDPWNQYPLSPHIGIMSGGGGSYGISPSVEYHCYYRLEFAGRLTGLQCEAISGYTGSTLRMGVYSLGPDALPHKLLAATDYIDSTNSGVKTMSNPALWVKGQEVWLNPGWYSIVFSCSYGIAMRGLLNGNSVNSGPSPIGRVGGGYAGNKAALSKNGDHYSVLPDIAGTTGYGIFGSIPWVGMRVQP